jgi:hypothetical protein
MGVCFESNRPSTNNFYLHTVTIVYAFLDHCKCLLNFIKILVAADGFLNATRGNVFELIITLFALHKFGSQGTFSSITITYTCI